MAKKVNPFAIAKSTSKQVKRVNKGTVLQIPVEFDDNGKQTEDNKKIHQSIKDYLIGIEKQKEAAGKIATAKGVINPVAIKLYTEQWCERNGQPVSPIEIIADSGSAVNLIVQNKADSSKWSEADHLKLVELVGEDEATDMIRTETTFGFNSEILKEEGVVAKLVDAINKSGLTQKQMHELVNKEEILRIRHDSITGLAKKVENNPDQLAVLLDVLSPVLTIYIKS